MNQDKYYTPEIEEFHVGFEYESHEDPRVDDGWMEQQVSELSLKNIYQYYFNDSDTDIRVKYLDQEDIESLEWKRSWNDCGWIGYDLKDFYMKVTDRLEVSIYDNHIVGGSIMFKGNIQNKSELKKLMKQLNIEV